MDAPDRPGRWLALAFVAVLTAACPPKKSPETVARTAEAKPATPAQPAEPAPPPAEDPATPGSVSDSVVVVNPGDPDAEQAPSLVEAARREKERRARAGKPVAVINDKTLSHYAKGQVTFAAPEKPASPAESAATAELEKERFWRARVLDVRLRWRSAADEVEKLETDSGDLRRRFYAEDDPFVRDGEIKPEWDRVLDRLRFARERIASAHRELDEVLEQGRREGALPGWLREGAENEPVPEKAKPADAEPGEPQGLDEGERHG